MWGSCLIFIFFFRVSNCRVWDAVYSCYYDGPVSWQAEEVVSVALESHRKVLTHLSWALKTECITKIDNWLIYASFLVITGNVCLRVL